MSVIQVAQKSDLKGIMQLEQDNEAWICPYSEEEHLAAFDNPDMLYLAVREFEKESLIAFFILRGLKNANQSLEIKRIVVGQKRKGYGRSCIEWIKRYCFQELKFNRLWLDVFTDNSRAQRLYFSSGFQKEGELREVIKKGEEYKNLYLLSILQKEYFKELD
jgi:RimJ/RimL family protein N-acetyltransferase